MSEWRPIETAPVGQYGLFWVVGCPPDEQWLMEANDKPVDMSAHKPRIAMGRNKSAWSSLEKATHWMPLPPPPTSASQQEQK